MSGETEKKAKANPQKLERSSLVVSKWSNLFMGCCGILAAWLSNSEALLLDGLFSGIGFISAIFAARVGQSVAKPPDAWRPFGYDADEALYITFRSLSLIGLILFALFSALARIITYASGGSVPELVYGPIVIYFVVIGLTCAGLAILHYVNWRRTGRKSDVLKLESNAAIVDGVITSAAGLGLMAVPFLVGTPLEIIVPVGDSVVLLFLCVLITFSPVMSLRKGLAELAGVSAGPASVKTVRRLARKLADEFGMRLVDVSVNKLGRNYTVAIYVDPAKPVLADEVDQLAKSLEDQALEALGTTRAYVMVTKHGRTWNATRFGSPDNPDVAGGTA